MPNHPGAVIPVYPCGWIISNVSASASSLPASRIFMFSQWNRLATSQTFFRQSHAFPCPTRFGLCHSSTRFAQHDREDTSSQAVAMSCVTSTSLSPLVFNPSPTHPHRSSHLSTTLVFLIIVQHWQWKRFHSRKLQPIEDQRISITLNHLSEHCKHHAKFHYRKCLRTQVRHQMPSLAELGNKGLCPGCTILFRQQRSTTSTSCRSLQHNKLVFHHWV